MHSLWKWLFCVQTVCQFLHVYAVADLNGGKPVILESPRNATVLSGSSVLFRCAVSGDPEPAVSWQKNGRSLHYAGHANYRVLESGDLKLDNVGLADDGLYHCIARNVKGMDYSPQARLRVEEPAKLKGGRSIYNVSWGSSVRLECSAQGEPPPVITWFQDGEPLDAYALNDPVYTHSELYLNATRTTSFTCKATNSLISLNSSLVTDSKQFQLYVMPKDEEDDWEEEMPPDIPGSEEEDFDEEEPVIENEIVEEEEDNSRRWDEKRPPEDPLGSGVEKPKEESPIIGNEVTVGYCAPYTGQICRRYLNGSGHVYYNFTSENHPIPLNEQITAELWSELISSLLEPCRSAAEVVLCSYAFPKCEWMDGVARLKPLCREDCIAIKELFCYNEWALVEDNKQRGIFFKSRGHFRLPDCNTLPPLSKTGKETCSNAHLTDMREDEITTDCIRARGRFYQGTMNVTKTGIACQRWDVQEPHHHNRPPKVFPEVLNSENYCRNAGGEEPVPWCYTMDPRVRWQHCDIPLCDNSSQISQPDNDIIDIFEPPSEPLFTPTFILMTCSLSLAAVVILLAIVLGLRRIRQKSGIMSPTPGGYISPNERPPHLGSNSDDPDVEIDLDKLPSNVSYHRTQAKLHPKLEKLEYPRNDIIYIRDIGQGAFGRVFQAKAPGLVKGEDFTMIAVKMLKDEASDDLQSDFEREACLMAEFDHPNIVKLLGVCAIGKPMCLLFEFMGKGDLNEFLRSCSPTNYIMTTGNGNLFSDVRLTHLDLTNIAKQVAAGMVYLSERKFVHRDLATRNCLVAEDMTVKISDFGLSQKIYAANYYKGKEDDAIPIRWMPLESILYNKFIVESDVWAFGVVLWEIFTFALQPYYGMTHEEVVKYVQEGNILKRPDDCPAAIYDLMKACWNRKPAARPPFKTIHKTLSHIYNDLLKRQSKDQRTHV
ncbi:tyrosine-protein kinase transmembrane receptor Ror2-like isoform X1 [Argiope bruennichi]|uniref:tyrosine-protein kinase transmembrane receptor Ror2-like isoform X1 n=2 Tax=Argiope bruennichi TaxID=94029 RepID=UPI002493DCF5|nr:tyrosine-protein kinase transmembrane receptor Ror2-like isoform X1 [Argiope bruennichi]